MTSEEVLTMVKSIIAGTDLADTTTDEQVKYAVSAAKSDLLQRIDEKHLDRYLSNWIEGAKWYLARIGVEGEASHSEQGVSRTFASVGNPPWLASIVPKVTVKAR